MLSFYPQPFPLCLFLHRTPAEMYYYPLSLVWSLADRAFDLFNEKKCYIHISQVDQVDISSLCVVCLFPVLHLPFFCSSCTPARWQLVCRKSVTGSLLPEHSSSSSDVEKADFKSKVGFQMSKLVSECPKELDLLRSNWPKSPRTCNTQMSVISSCYLKMSAAPSVNNPAE